MHPDNAPLWLLIAVVILAIIVEVLHWMQTKR